MYSGYTRVLDVLWAWCFVFVKQKTAYEMRISDWSSDVCSSDLAVIDRKSLRSTARERWSADPATRILRLDHHPQARHPGQHRLPARARSARPRSAASRSDRKRVV